MAALPAAVAAPGEGDAEGIAVGRVHTCVLKSDGNVDCYGSNEGGRAADYTGGDATAVAADYEHTCVLQSSGNVDCYGGNTWGQVTDYTGGDATAVGTGWTHTCVLRSNGNVDCSGGNAYGQANDYAGGDATAIAVGDFHTCILKPNGNVDCFGYDVYGQAADYTGGDAIAVAAGGYHTCVLKSDGNVDCHGDNGSAQAADYTGGDATAVATGVSHTCVLRSGGNVDCYGDNSNGKTADYTGSDATSVAAGWYTTCVLRSGGNVDCYGYQSDDRTADYVGGDGASVAAGGWHTCVRKSSGNVDCYGYDGFGAATDYTGGDATALGLGGQHTCVLKSNGNVDCYGWGGGGMANDYTGGDATAVTAGSEHTCILKSSGNVDCYGIPSNDFGQGADYNGGDATAVAAGQYHTCVLKLSGNVDCYGRNIEGQAADYTGGDATAVAAGQYHTCVLKSNGNVDCYGSNLEGQAADYAGGDATAVAAGGEHTCVLRSNGNVDCYGSNEYLQAADYTGGDATGIAAGGLHTCIRKSSGNVDCHDVLTGADYEVPDAPSPQATAGPQAGALSLAWSTPANQGTYPVINYRVYRSASSGGPFAQIAELGNVFSYTDSGLGSSATRHYKVTAINSIGESVQSAVASATTSGPPAAPALAAEAGPGAGQIRLEWTAAPSGSPVTSYKVYRGAASGSLSLVTSGGCSGLGNVLACTDSGLGDGTTRHYKVSAVNSDGEGSQSNEASATTFSLPSAPQGLTATAGAGQITLSWQTPSNEGGSAVTSYRVYRGTSSGSLSLVTSGGCSGLGAALACTDSGLGDGATRHYRLSAVNLVGEGAQSSEASATTFDVPSPPQGLSASAGSGPGQIVLAWQAPAGNGGSAVTGYKIYRGAASGSEAHVATVGDVLAWTDSGLGDGVTRFYKVKAVNLAGESAFSNGASATTNTYVPTAPQNLEAASGTSGTTLTWEAPSSSRGSAITGYNVYRGTASGSATFLASAGSTLTYTDTACGAGTVCHYQVTAINGVGESDRSNEASAPGTFTPDPAPPDEDGDGVPDEEEPAACASENPNLQSDGQCSGDDYTPGTADDAVSDAVWLATGERP